MGTRLPSREGLVFVCATRDGQKKALVAFFSFSYFSFFILPLS